jgi:hypothetical protein
MRRNLSMDLERYPGTRMLLIGPPWMLELQKMHGGHFTYSSTRNMLGWLTPTIGTLIIELLVVPYIIPVPVYEGVLNNVRGLLAVANTALDDTNNTLVAAQQKILTLEIQKHAS